jgi:lysozyme family protein
LIIPQRATDDVMGTDLREPDPKKPKVKVYDGNIGPKTRSTIKRAVDTGKAQAINNRMMELRLQLMEQHPKYEEYKGGWVPRAKSFGS